MMDCGLDSRSHLDASGDLRFSLGSLAETQSDHYRSTKVIRRPRRGRVGLRRDEQKVGALNSISSWALCWASLLPASLSSSCRLSLWESKNGALSNLAFWVATRLRATQRCRILTTMTERPFSALWIYCLLEDIQMLRLWQWCCKNNWMPSIKRSGQSILCEPFCRLGLNCVVLIVYPEIEKMHYFQIHLYSNERSLYFLKISPQRSPRENVQGEQHGVLRLTLAAHLL